MCYALLDYLTTFFKSEPEQYGSFGPYELLLSNKQEKKKEKLSLIQSWKKQTPLPPWGPTFLVFFPSTLLNFLQNEFIFERANNK